MKLVAGKSNGVNHVETLATMYTRSLFEANFFTQLSWSGISRTAGVPKKTALNAFVYFLDFMTSALRESFPNFTSAECEQFFKYKVLRNSASHSKYKGMRSTHTKVRMSMNDPIYNVASILQTNDDDIIQQTNEDSISIFSGEPDELPTNDHDETSFEKNQNTITIDSDSEASIIHNLNVKMATLKDLANGAITESFNSSTMITSPIEHIQRPTVPTNSVNKVPIQRPIDTVIESVVFNDATSNGSIEIPNGTVQKPINQKTPKIIRSVSTPAVVAKQVESNVQPPNGSAHTQVVMSQTSSNVANQQTNCNGPPPNSSVNTLAVVTKTPTPTVSNHQPPNKSANNKRTFNENSPQPKRHRVMRKDRFDLMPQFLKDESDIENQSVIDDSDFDSDVSKDVFFII